MLSNAHGIEDRCVLVVCDPRLLKKCDYGQVFLDSMPSMVKTRDPADAVFFLPDGIH